jgi:hypothetical protein
MYIQNQKIIGYHGTYPEYVDSILANNFKESKDHDIWIGDGVYFFVEGAGVYEPQEYAKQFAIDNCYDKEVKKHTKEEVCVLEASIRINGDKFLDLTDSIGAQLFNKFRRGVISKIEKSGKRPVMGGYNDTDVFKIMREELGIEFVKSNVYIRFAIQRIAKFESRIPNVTILVVNNPLKNILKPTIKVILKEEIK